MTTLLAKSSFLLLLCALLLSACGRVTMTVNADRSGKLEVSIQLPPAAVFGKFTGNDNGGAPPPPSLEEVGKSVYRQFALGSAGFEAWTVPQITEGDDFNTFTMTGYFPDANKVDMGSFDKGLGKHLDNPRESGTVGSSKSPDGKRWLLLVSKPREISSPGAPVENKLPDPEVEDEIRIKVKELKSLFAPMLPLLSQMIKHLPADLGQRTEVIPAGEIERAEGMKTDGASAWTFESLRDNFELVKRVYSDDQILTFFAQEAQRQGVGFAAIDWQKSPASTQEFLRNFLIKTNSSAAVLQQLTVIPGRPLFDYATEAKTARIASAEYVAQLRESLAGRTSAGAAKIPPHTPMIGIRFTEDHTTRIESVVPSSPAALAGLKIDDVIEEIDGKKVGTSAAVTDGIRARKPGEKIRVSVMRDGGSMQFDVVIGRAGDLEPRP